MSKSKLMLGSEEVFTISKELGQMVGGLCSERGITIDRIGYIPRGGLAVANVAGRVIGGQAEHYQALSVKSYDNDTNQQVADDLQLLQMPDLTEVVGHSWVLFDEVCDTGDTLRATRDWLLASGANDVITAVLHAKPHRTFDPDLFISETDQWIVYPWEQVENPDAQVLAMSGLV